MTDEQLQQRANLYARQAVIAAESEGDGRVVTLIARAFVIGYATGLEESARLARGARVRK